MPKPNLFLVGAMKSGTTYLAGLLASHPDVFMCDPKEPSYFVDPDQLRKIYPWMWEKGYHRSESRYLRLFDEAGDRPVVVDASTAYTKLPRITGVPERIQRFAPDARFVYIMRDPIERAISHYWYSVWMENEERPPLEAIAEDDLYIAVSDYAAQLGPYLDLFGESRVKALTFEALRDHPRETFADLLSWLGVDPGHVPESLGVPALATPEEFRRPSGVRRFIRRLPGVQRLKGVLPARALELARFLTEVGVEKTEEDMGEVVAYLRPILDERTRELERLLGREFPEWTSLSQDRGPRSRRGSRWRRRRGAPEGASGWGQGPSRARRLMSTLLNWMGWLSLCSAI